MPINIITFLYIINSLTIHFYRALRQNQKAERFNHRSTVTAE
jgi:hypothetical protein